MENDSCNTGAGIVLSEKEREECASPGGPAKVWRWGGRFVLGSRKDSAAAVSRGRMCPSG